MAAKKGGLGKGLDALFGENTLDTDGNVTTLRLTDIEPNKDQPRQDFDEVEKRFHAMGFDRVFGPGTAPEVTIAALKKDLLGEE